MIEPPAATSWMAAVNCSSETSFSR
jgi:hypothetical protein